VNVNVQRGPLRARRWRSWDEPPLTRSRPVCSRRPGVWC